ncbi:MAG: F0F1 ATP synthase subunit delta, partial [Candidatus Sungbacteria bacterium]|nr:F0F1 ATP synthase subunit delta [Candidatus Sungbacteria bacterium]
KFGKPIITPSTKAEKGSHDESVSGDEIIKRFARLLAKTGDIGRAEKIAAAVEKLTVKAKGGRWVTVEFARPIEAKIKRRITKIFSTKDKIEEKINPGLVAGVRVTLDSEKEFDNSFQRKLKKLFAN